MYSILRDRLDLSIKNNWKDEKDYIYLIFSIEELSKLLEINKETVTSYKRNLVKYKLIIDKRLRQGKSNMIYVLKPEIKDFLNTGNPFSSKRKNTPLEYGNSDPIDTYVNYLNLNNVNKVSKGEIYENLVDINYIRKKIRESLEEKDKVSFPELKNLGKEDVLFIKENNPEKSYFRDNKMAEYSIKRRSVGKEQLAKEIAEELDDDHSLGAFRAAVDKISEQQIRIFLRIIKDTHLTGKIKKNKGAMFISLAKEYAKKNNIDLNFK